MEEITRQNLLPTRYDPRQDSWNAIASSPQPELTETMPAAAPANIVTIVSVSIAVVLAIVILFGLAYLIDYRQQKITERQQQCIVKKRRRLKLSLPRCRRVRGIVEDAEDVGVSRPPLETITEVV